MSIRADSLRRKIKDKGEVFMLFISSK